MATVDGVMRRRQILAAAVSGVAGVSGCSVLEPESDATDGPDGSEPRTNATNEANRTGTRDGEPSAADRSPTIPDPTGTCGPAAVPLSERMTTDPGSDCDDDREPEFAVRNERDDPITATVTIRSGETVAYEATFELDHEEQFTDRIGVPVSAMETVTVRTEYDDKFSESWQGQSCLRHAVAIQSDGTAVGYLEPIGGADAGTNRCYTGEGHEFSLKNTTTEHYDVTVSVVDHCAETTTALTQEINPQMEVGLDLPVVLGGNYTLGTNVHGHGATTQEFDAFCGSSRIEVTDGGGVEIAQYGTY